MACGIGRSTIGVVPRALAHGMLLRMSTQVSNAAMTLGVMSIVGGLCAMGFGCLDKTVMVTGWGPLDGFWRGVDYFNLGAVLAVAGSGVFTLGYLNRGPRVAGLG